MGIAVNITYRWYPAKRALPAMLTHGRWGPFGRIPSLSGSIFHLLSQIMWEQSRRMREGLMYVTPPEVMENGPHLWSGDPSRKIICWHQAEGYDEWKRSQCLLLITVTSWWARWHPKSPVSRLFAKPFVQGQIKENIIAPCYWPLRGESTGDRVVLFVINDAFTVAFDFYYIKYLQIPF